MVVRRPVKRIASAVVGRTVTLVLVDAAGEVLGATAPLRLALPFWQEAADVVAAAREHCGVGVDVLRMLRADRPAPPGGHLTVLAQAHGVPAAPLAPVAVDLHPDPLRAPWAVPGGPAASVRWAVDALAASGSAGRAASGSAAPGPVVAVQQRSWNLSAVWRLDLHGSPVAWLKQVPWFLAHEPVLLRLLGRVAPGLAPRLLADGPEGRQLLAHVPGEDRYGAPAALRAGIAADWHPVQSALVDAAGELVAAGVPDRRDVLSRVAAVATPHRRDIPGLGALVDDLPARLAAVAACAVPCTLVHGDLHPGNVRTDGARRVILDWGDASVGHPAYDILRLIEGLPPVDAAARVAAWAGRWRAAVPGSDPARAAALLRPVAALLAAAQYDDFLRSIEASERPYHAADVADRLTAAVAVAGAAPEPGIPWTS